MAIVTLADVLVRRADLGRRRALGATRATIVALVVLRTLIPALLGAVGVAAGMAFTGRLGAVPPWDFTTGTAVLALLAAVVHPRPRQGAEDTVKSAAIVASPCVSASCVLCSTCRGSQGGE